MKRRKEGIYLKHFDFKRLSERTRWRRSRWTWNTSLHGYIRNTSLDIEVHAVHLLRADSSTDQRKKNIYNPPKLSRTKELGVKTGVLVGLDLSSVGGGTEAEF